MRKWLYWGVMVLAACGETVPKEVPTPSGPGPADAGTGEGGSDASVVDARREAEASAPTKCTPLAVPPKMYWRSEVVAEGLSNPWSIDPLPNGDWLVTEKGDYLKDIIGRIRIIKGGKLREAPVPGAPVSRPGPQGGLLDIVLHPDFAVNHLLYVSYVGTDGEAVPKYAVKVTRYLFENDELKAPKDVFPGYFVHDVDGHYGGRMVFGADRKLYLTLGETHTGPQPQQLDSLAGKTIRLNDDGTIPTDNPFVGTAGARGEIFTLGHRNPQGIALQPKTNNIFVAEHGPTGCDEINWLRPGLNYGWPDYTCDQIGDGFTQAQVQFTPSQAPSGTFFYTGLAFPGWCENMFFAALAGEGVVRVVFDGTKFVSWEKLFYHVGAWRIRDVAQGLDGYVYYAEDIVDEARILRLVPTAAPPDGGADAAGD